LNQKPNDYIRNSRLDHAMFLLKTEKEQVAYVAMEVGFSDSKYFSRRFKARFGLSPNQVLREQIVTKQESLAI